jgi:hypothetical protein
MITFSVIRDDSGWTIQTGAGMTTPFRSRESAINEARCLAEAIRRHGQCVEVIVESGNSGNSDDIRRNFTANAPRLILRGKMTSA